MLYSQKMTDKKPPTKKISAPKTTARGAQKKNPRQDAQEPHGLLGAVA